MAAVILANTKKWQLLPAKIISYLLHPVFMPTLFFIWVVYRFPLEFNIAGIDGNIKRGLVVAINTFLFPTVATLLLWRLQFINSIYLKTQKERIVPYLITMFFYWWIYYLSRNFLDQPLALQSFFLGNFICISLALTLNTFFKISMHAMGVFGIVTASIITCFFYQQNMGLDITVALLLAGMVCSARLALSAHNNSDVYRGIFVSIISQLIAAWYTLT